MHWMTKSYAHHKVLDEAHGDFSDKLDEFVESCIGANDVRKFQNVSIAFEMPDSDDDIVDIFDSAFNDLMTSLGKYANTPALESILDDLNNLANKTIYLLKMK
jgi:hypothetical protein